MNAFSCFSNVLSLAPVGRLPASSNIHTVIQTVHHLPFFFLISCHTIKHILQILDNFLFFNLSILLSMGERKCVRASVTVATMSYKGQFDF